MKPRPKPAETARPRTSRARLAAAVALVVAIVLAPTLARTPQSGDGAEIVSVAVQGGVLHPPGFPLQAWIDRGLAAIPGVEPALAISAFGLLAHAATAGVLVAILSALGAGVTAALAGAAAFAFFPCVWRLAVEPEVFALPSCAIAIAVWLVVRGRAVKPLEAGLIAGLGAATHPIFLAALPALAVATLSALGGNTRRGAQVAVYVAALVLPPLALYFSLPLLRTASPWPDWGALASPADVLRHALRLEYGALSLSAAGGATMSALATWAIETARTWNLGLALAGLGAAGLRSRTTAAETTAIFGTLAAALLILALGHLPVQTYSVAYLEKLEGPAVLIGALLVGLGVDAAGRRWFRSTAARRGLGAAVALAAIAWLVTGWPAADASRDRTLALHQQGVGAELADSTVYVTEGDVESFMGAPTATGRRFPIQGPELSFEWYWRAVAPRIEPRLLANRPPPASWGDFVRSALARGLSVAGSSRTLVAAGGTEPRLRGLLYFAGPAPPGGDSQAAIDAAIRLAPLAAQLPALPPGRRELSWFYARRFARAYLGAADALSARGAQDAAVRADSVVGAILRGLPVGERHARLEAFVLAARDSAEARPPL